MKWLQELSDERLQLLLGFAFGFAVLGAFIFLSVVIGIGHVEQTTSFGLQDVLEGLAALGGGFIGWWHAWHAGKRGGGGNGK